MLEAYVLGALSPAERADVEAGIARYPEVAAEVASLEESLLALARRDAEQPPAGLEDRIWAAIQSSDPAAGQSVSSGTDTVDTSSFTPTIIPLSGGAERGRQLRWQQAAVWIALGASLLTNFLLWADRNRAERGSLVLQQRIDSLDHRQEQLLASLQGYEKERAILMNPDMKMVVMHSMKPGEPMAGMVFFDKQKGDTYLSLYHMPEPPKGRQYQLWVMQNGQPVDMGVIPADMVGGGVQKMLKTATGGEAFAISLEKEGGSPVPTMEEIRVMGKTSS